MAKKKKRDISKRRAKKREKIKRNRSLQLVKSRAVTEPKTILRSGLPHMGAPEGFRSISMSQAIVEYAKPLFEFAKDEENALNDTLQIGNLLTKLRKSGLIINTGSRTASRWELIKKG